MHGTAASDPYWSDIMRRARNYTNLTGQKTRVTAVLNTERSARYLGRKYDYVIEVPEDSFFYKRCAVPGPSGKVCVLGFYGNHLYHLSRGLTKDTFTVWNFVAEFSNRPTNYKTNKITCQHVTAAEAKDMGFDVSRL